MAEFLYATLFPSAQVALASPPPAEHVLRLATTGVFVTGAKLFVELYFLLRVAQTGLVWSNWLRCARSDE